MTVQISVPTEHYLQILMDLEAAGVSYCLLRDRLDGEVVLRDLDILIPPSDLARGIALLEERGFMVRRPLSKGLHKTTMIACDERGALHLDIHVRPVQQGLIFMDVELLMSDLVREGDCWTPKPEHRLALLVVHNVLGKGCIQEKHLGQIDEITRHGVDSGVLKKALSGYGIYDHVNEVVENLDQYTSCPERCVDMQHRMYRKLLWKNRAHWKQLLKVWWLEWLYYHGVRRKGTLIALIGPDGSGKSSLAHALSNAIEDVFGRDAPIVYMGPWGQFKLGLTRRVRYNPWANGARSWGRFIAEARSRNPIYLPILVLKYLKYHAQSFLGLFVLYLELLYRYWAIYRLLRVGRHVIADRYIYDLWVGGMHVVIEERSRSIRFLSRLFPKPDLCLYVTNAAEVLYERKQELDVTSGRAVLRVYERIAESVGARTLETNQPPHELATRIVRSAYRDMLAKMRI